MSGKIVGTFKRNNLQDQEATFEMYMYLSNTEIYGYASGVFWNTNSYPDPMTGDVSTFHTGALPAELEGKWYYDDMRLCPMCGQGHGQFRAFFKRPNWPGWGQIIGEFGDWSIPPADSLMPVTGTWYWYLNNNSGCLDAGFN